MSTAKNNSSISSSLAYQLVTTYNCVPNTRHMQEELLHMRGYSQLQGKPLSSCSSPQIYTVAQKVLEEAYQQVKGKSRLQSLLQTRCEREYHARLYEMFEIPLDDSSSNYLSPSELERILLD